VTGTSRRIERSQIWIAMLAAAGILIHLGLRYLTQAGSEVSDIPLYVAVAAGGIPLLWTLGQRLIHLEFGSDLLAGLSIAAAAITGQYLWAQLSCSCFPVGAHWNRMPRNGRAPS